MTDYVANSEDSVRIWLQEYTPLALGWIFAAVVVVTLLASLRDRMANVVREPGPPLIVGGVTFAVGAFVSFLVGAALPLALAIGGGAGIVVMMMMAG